MTSVLLLTQHLFRAMNDQDLHALGEIFDEGVSFDFPGLRPMQGKKTVLFFLQRLYGNFEYLTFTQTGVLSDGARACVFWENEGVWKGAGPYRNAGATLVEATGGKITLLSDYFKSHASKPT
ncbi:nuclear transport factor 2 family protein [Caldimonas brevitalea]|uniref:Ketosteroid isomerase-related protein n=1 Tax=Caldimonas brevitalea TaxID=413882 RepID=A8KCJ3_9BURK|nr:nuclear transport factor 2 family protein [Caldimonas brevitalea]AKJ29076.1 ketosteroid isomerase-related protein [Caldimonas brevitalea]CAL80825.1 ketosteroid isomerase-related protein [Caldimonas brevitalea]